VQRLKRLGLNMISSCGKARLQLKINRRGDKRTILVAAKEVINKAAAGSTHILIFIPYHNCNVHSLKFTTAIHASLATDLLRRILIPTKINLNLQVSTR